MRAPNPLGERAYTLKCHPSTLKPRASATMVRKTLSEHAPRSMHIHNAEDFTGLSARPRSTCLDLFGPLPLHLDLLPLLLLPALLGFLRVPLSLLLFQPLLVFLAEDFVEFSLTELLEFLLHACRGRQHIHTLRYETRGETRQAGRQADRA